MAAPDESELIQLLAALEEGLDDDPVWRGGQSSTDATAHGLIENLRESPEAQLTLLLLAWEIKSDAVDTDAALEAELERFGTQVREAFGIDLLRAAANNAGALPPEFPTQLLPEPTHTTHASG